MKKLVSLIVSAAMLLTSAAFSVASAEVANQVLANGKTTVEAELIGATGGVVKTSGVTNVSGGAALVFDGEYKGETYTSTINAEKAGFYSVNVLANTADGTASTLTFGINGETFALTTSSAKSNVEGSKGIYGLQMYRFDDVQKVYLNEGANTMTITVGKRPGYETYILATLDALEFVPTEFSEKTVLANGKSTLEAENFTWAYSSKKDYSGASAGSSVHWDTGIGAANQKITVYAENAGFYDMTVVAGALGANDAYSTLTFKVNGTSKTLAASDVVADGSSFKGYAGLMLNTFNVFSGVYLEKGPNDIEVTIGPRPGAASSVLAQIDAFSFTPNTKRNVVAGSETVIEAENLTWAYSGKSDYASASGGSVVRWDAGIAAANQKVSVFVEEAGLYDMSVIAGALGASDSYSTLSLKINGVSKTLAASDIIADGLSFSGYAGLPVKTFNAYNALYLEAGLNDIEITFGARPGYPNNVLVQIDAFKFVPNTSRNVSASAETVIEAENLTWAYSGKSDYASASGGSVVRWDAGIGAANQKITVFAEKAGLYDVDVIAGAFGASDTYSALTFKVNGVSKTLAASDIIADGLSFAGYAGLPVKTFNAYKAVYLEEGGNDIEITIGARPGSPNNVLAQIDAFKFVPNTSRNVLADTKTIIEAENFTWVYNSKSAFADASGGSSVYWDSGIAAANQKVTVFAESAGLYDVNVIAGAFGASDTYSALTFKVNGVSKTLAASDIIADGLSFKGYAGLPVKTFKAYKALNLEAGLNDIEITMGPRPGAASSVLALIDAFVFAPARDITDISVELSDVISLGEEAVVSILDQDGLVVENADVYQITYDSDNENVLTVDGNGKVTAVGTGVATISVSVMIDENTEEISQEIEVFVVTDAGVYVKNAQNQNGTVSFDFVAEKAYSNMSVYVVAYDAETGSVTSIGNADISSGDAGEAEKAVTLDGYAEDDDVVIYVWQGMSPEWCATEVR